MGVRRITKEWLLFREDRAAFLNLYRQSGWSWVWGWDVTCLFCIGVLITLSRATFYYCGVHRRFSAKQTACNPVHCTELYANSGCQVLSGPIVWQCKMCAISLALVTFHVPNSGACASISVHWTADWASLCQGLILADDRIQSQDFPLLTVQEHARQVFEERGTLDGFIRWRTVLSGVGGASSDGASSFLVVEALHQMSHLSVVLVVLYRMAQSLVRFWWRFIRWRTVSSGAGETFGRRSVLSGAGGALSYGSLSVLMLVALFSGADGSSLGGTVLRGSSGASSDGAPSFLVVAVLVVAVLVVALHQMTQSLVRWLWRFIRWRTFFVWRRWRCSVLWRRSSRMCSSFWTITLFL